MANGVDVNDARLGYHSSRSPLSNAVTSACREQVTRMVSLGRSGMQMEVTAVVAFLASEKASFVMGAEFVVKGGRSL